MQSGAVSPLACVALCLILVPNQSSAQPHAVTKQLGWFQLVLGSPGSAIPPTSGRVFKPVDAWFSYRPAETVGAGHGLEMSSKDSESSAASPFGTLAEEIIVIGERQKRDFALLKPNAELTGPMALEAAQPFVPLPGATCTYKNLCYDMAQPPLRATIPRLLSVLTDN